MKNEKPLGIVISAFPGMGKSYCTNNAKDFEELTFTDSDSSKFSWIIDSEGNKVRNPNFIEEYMDHIQHAMKKYDVIFVSSHEPVRHALIENNIPHLLVYPDKSRKQEFIDNYINRSNDEKFIELLLSNWDNWIDEIDNEENVFGRLKIRLSAMYMADVIRLLCVPLKTAWSKLI